MDIVEVSGNTETIRGHANQITRNSSIKITIRHHYLSSQEAKIQLLRENVEPWVL
jgi:hypothetical protein